MLLALVATNGAWIYYNNQFEDSVVTEQTVLGSQTNQAYCYIAVYDSNKNCIKSSYSKDYCNISSNASVADSNDWLTQLTFNEGVSHADISNMRYVRISALSITDSSEIHLVD